MNGMMSTMLFIMIVTIMVLILLLNRLGILCVC